MSFGFGVGIQRLGSVGVDTQSALLALPSPGAALRPTGFVFADPDPTKNGVYTWTGSSWQRDRGLPEQIATLDVTGGDENDIIATVQAGVDLAQISLVRITPAGTNTGPVSINTKPVLDAAGNALDADQFVGGQTYILVANADNYQSIIGSFASAAQGAKADSALQQTSPIFVPSYLVPAIPVAPPIIKANGDEWSIFAFKGGETERAKDTSIADYQETFSTAVATGEKIKVPRWEFPVRSLSLTGEINAGVNVQADTPIDVVCASGAKFIAGECFVGLVSSMIRFVGDTTPTDSTNSILTPFSWRGGIMSGEALTAAHGAGSGFGVGLMDVSQYFNPLIEGVLFDAGVTTPALNSIGCGYIDTGLGMHGNIGSQVIGNGFRGLFDAGVYDNGIRQVVTLGTNPLNTTSGSPIVGVHQPAHGLTTGERPGIAGTSALPIIALGGLSLFGEYAVTVVDPDNYTITAAANATSTTSGGTGARVTMPISQTEYMSIGGEQSVYQRNYFLRVGNTCLAVKRNLRHVDISHNRFRETSNAVALAPIDVAMAEGHKALITHNTLTRITGHGLRVIGGGMFVTIADNHIENFGKQLFDETVYTNFSTDFPPTAIWLQSVLGANVHDNTIAQTGKYKDLTGIIAGEEPCAIRLSKNPNMIDGSKNCKVHDNNIIDVPRPFLDQTGNSANRWENNPYSGNSVPAIITPTDSILIEPDSKGSGTCLLKGTVGDFSSYDLHTYHWYKHGDVVTLAVYIDLAATTGGSGNITIGGYTPLIGGAPPAARTTAPASQALGFAVKTSGQLTHSAAGFTEFQADISAGGNIINLFEVGNNVILPLTEARFGGGTRMAITGSYIAN
jgi:hypothetical protein